MLHISQLIMKTLLTLKKCNPGDQIIIKTYKKDRSITIKKLEQYFEVTEQGFENKVYEVVQEDELKKLLKLLKDKEFPRSNQIWFSIKKA